MISFSTPKSTTRKSRWAGLLRAVTLPTVMVYLFVGADAHAQLRIVSYNTLDKPFNATADAQFTTIMSAIDTTPVNGIAKRVDILALQEQTNQIGNNTAARSASLLNSLYGVSSYSTAVVGGGTDKVAYVYDSATVQLLGSSTFILGTRPAHRLQVRPQGYTSADADIYLYNVHLNASSSTTRSSEVTNLLANAETLATSLSDAGQNANFVYTGDFNFGSSAEAGYANLTSPGVAEGFDPLNAAGWPFSSNSGILTQSTRSGNLSDGGASGGVDDRFDLQIVTSDVMDGEGMSYIGPTAAGSPGLDHSYRAFGNDGTSYNTSITSPATGRSQPAGVLQALHDFSDHLPVVVDYQVPAVLSAVAGAVPATLNQGEAFSIDVSIANAASVVAAVGADELDYMISTMGDVTGSANGSAFALAPANLHSFMLDTSRVGIRSGTITVTSDSQGVQNFTVTIPIEFEVLAPLLAGDYNDDGRVDAADYTVWRDTVGSLTDVRADGTGPVGLPDGVIDQFDYDFWKENFGSQSGGAGSVGQVPEPSVLTLWLLVAAFCATRWRDQPGNVR